MRFVTVLLVAVIVSGCKPTQQGSVVKSVSIDDGAGGRSRITYDVASQALKVGTSCGDKPPTARSLTQKEIAAVINKPEELGLFLNMVSRDQKPDRLEGCKSVKSLAVARFAENLKRGAARYEDPAEMSRASKKMAAELRSIMSKFPADRQPVLKLLANMADSAPTTGVPSLMWVSAVGYKLASIMVAPGSEFALSKSGQPTLSELFSTALEVN